MKAQDVIAKWRNMIWGQPRIEPVVDAVLPDRSPFRMESLLSLGCWLTALAINPLQELPLAEEWHFGRGLALLGRAFTCISTQDNYEGPSQLYRYLWDWLRALLRLYHHSSAPSNQFCFLPFLSLSWEHSWIKFLHSNSQNWVLEKPVPQQNFPLSWDLFYSIDWEALC